MANINNEKCCTCTTPEITIKLNKQGPQGLTGPKGEDGFSPIVEVAQNTYTTYTLNITDAEKTITTPNLKATIPSGGQAGDVLTKSSTEDGVYDWQSLPIATETNKGIIQIATLNDFEIDEDEGELGEGGYTHAVTPNLLEKYITSKYPAPENIVLTTNVDQEILGYKKFLNSQIKLSPSVFGVNYIYDGDGNYWFQHFSADGDELGEDHFGHPYGRTILEGDTITWRNPKDTTEYKILTTLDKATTTSLGIVKPDGDTITIDTDGTIHSVNSGSTYELPIASSNTLGGIKIGQGLSITEDGVVSATNDIDPTKVVTIDTEQTISGEKTFTAPINTSVIKDSDNHEVAKLFGGSLYLGDTNVPIVLQGNNISTFFPSTGSFKNQGGEKYLVESDLKTASTTQLGLVKVGENLTIEADGTLNAIASGGGGAEATTTKTETDGDATTTVTSTMKLVPTAEINGTSTSGGATIELTVHTVVVENEIPIVDTTTYQTFDLSKMDRDINMLKQVINGGKA